MVKRRKRGEVCHMERLPSDLKLKIIENLSARDRLTLECVSTEWRRLLPSDEFWYNMCYADKRWRKMWNEMLCGRNYLMLKINITDYWNKKKKICYLDERWSKMWDKLLFSDFIKLKKNSDDDNDELWNHQKPADRYKMLPEGWNSWKELFILLNIVGGDQHLYMLGLFARRMDSFASVIASATNITTTPIKRASKSNTSKSNK